MEVIISINQSEYSIALIPDNDRVKIVEVCFKIDCGFFYWVFTWDLPWMLWFFLIISTGTGFIITFELFFIGEEISLFLGETCFEPQLINFDCLMIYGDLWGDVSTLSLSLFNKLMSPRYFVILFNYSSFSFFFFLRSSSAFALFCLWLLDFLEINELSKELQILPKEEFNSYCFWDLEESALLFWF